MELLHSKPWEGLHPAANVSRYIMAGLITILSVFGVLGAWAAIAPLHGAVIATGFIKVDTNRKTIQHLEGGIVKQILVRDGDRVQEGQPLIVLQDERVGATLDLLQGQLDSELARAARLRAERDNQEAIEYPADLLARSDFPAVAEIMRSENAFFTTKRESLAEQIELLKQQIGEAQQQIAGLKSQIDAEEQGAKYLQEEIAANEKMEKKQYVQRTHILSLKRGIEEYEARKGEHLADIAMARQRITELELKIIDLKNAQVREAADKLTLSQAAINDILERLRPARDATSRQSVTAPIAGTVVNLKIFTEGGVIGPREPILDIVPEDNPLIIEARVRVDDIDDVKLEQEADIRLSAYKARSTPLILGHLIYISADRLIDETTGEPYYNTHIEVDQASLEEAGSLEMYPGMPAEVYIKTGARTALDYILAPITQTLRRSMRES